MTAVNQPANTALTGRYAQWFVILLGVVSLFADMTYEGARSITGPFLAVLGASGTVVGIVAGLGELIGYGLRLGSGTLSDRTGRYWPITFIGYFLNLLSVPVLALAGTWPVAALLMLTERAGKATRNPARDAMLSYATQRMGRGWGFGLHEAMDQLGATLGPLIVAALVFATGGYRLSFAILVIPALCALAVLFTASRLFPRPRDLEVPIAHIQRQGLPRRFWGYLAAGTFIAAGYADFPLIAFHFQKAHVAAPGLIPVLYAVGMVAAAGAALLWGRLFDRLDWVVLPLATLIAAAFAPLVFFGGLAAAIIGMILWGIGLGMQESALRAALAAMVPPDRRGSLYGIFDTGFGVAWFVGSVLMGILYDRSLLALVIFSVAAQLLALPAFVVARRLSAGAAA
jgi:MFS family permease